MSDTSPNNKQEGWTGVNAWMVRYAVFLSHGLIQNGYPRALCAHKSCRVCAQSVRCHVRDTRRASRAPLPRPYHNQRVELRLCRQRVEQQHKEKLGLEQHFRAIDFLP